MKKKIYSVNGDIKTRYEETQTNNQQKKNP